MVSICYAGQHSENELKKTREAMAALMDKVSASQIRDGGFEPHTGHDHDSSYDTSTG